MIFVKVIKLSGLSIASILVSGCAGFHTVENPVTLSDYQGAVYFMPKKDLLVTVTMSNENDGIPTVELSTSSAYPDYTKPYVLRHNNNIFADNKLDISLENGLLTKVHSKVKNQISTGLSEAISATASEVIPKKDEACAPGTINVFRVPLDGIKEEVKERVPLDGIKEEVKEDDNNKVTYCGLKLKLYRKAVKALPASNVNTESSKTTSGVYYRANVAYIATVSYSVNEKKFYKEAIIFSPTGSPTYFLPAKKTMFADNDAQFTLDSGVLTGFVQESKSEFVQTLVIPAKIIAYYAGAVGNIFESFKKIDDTEISKIEAEYSYEYKKGKAKDCKEAINNNPQWTSEEITAYGCNIDSE